MKRFIDILISIFLLFVFSPVLFISIILVKWKIGAPVIYKQNRPGLKGKVFCLYKLRTMTNQRNCKGELLSDHLRMTKLGRWLRRYSIDEIPQLINVIKGDMSLVGPRPLLVEYLPLYTEEQSRRHDVRPGITGWAQVNGRNSITWEEKLRLDVWYVDHQSFWLDIRIVLLTILKVLKTEGISQDGHETTEKFRG